MIDDYLIRLEGHLKDIKSLLQALTQGGTLTQAIAPKEDDYLSEFNALKQLLHSDEWPVAVEPDVICDETNYRDKQNRAEGIMDFMIEDDLTGKSFLDFGCGDGLCVLEAVRRGSTKAIGYDLKSDFPEGTNANARFTTSWDTVVKNGPYDYIFVFDVLDHVVSETPESVMRKVRSVCHADTKILVRCHPWCSRTATHVYRQLNKAYLHLIFTDIELTRLGLTGEPCEKVIHPQLSYGVLFNNTGFTIAKEPEKMTEDLENFFSQNSMIAARIKKNWATSHEPTLASGQAFPEHQLKMQFLDYTLKPR
jgi:2-polyprenyl-3-methyl-5-hydroxy-6-metoxy-1,4-benzoquinol methylase